MDICKSYNLISKMTKFMIYFPKPKKLNGTNKHTLIDWEVKVSDWHEGVGLDEVDPYHGMEQFSQFSFNHCI